MNAKKGIAITIVGAFILVTFYFIYYLFNCALTIYNPFVSSVLVGAVIWFLLAVIDKSSDLDGTFAGAVIGIVIGVVLVGILSIANSSAFNSGTYSSLFTYTEKEFEDFSASLDNIPLLDKTSADNIAKRKFGELTDYVSQYKVVDSEQIIYKGKPVRLSILEHTGFWRWKKNKTSPGYIIVDMQTQKAELVRTEKPIVYSERTFFGKNIERYIRSNYKTKLFFYPTAELNEEGEVYWIAPTYKRVVGLYGGRLIDGVIAVNAHTGEHKYYTDLNNIPEWIDNVYPSKYIMEQYDYKGKLSNGFWNTVFSKTGMTMTTDGYNYLPIGNDNWIYTGITSVSMADESNIAFILTNKRTLETYYYAISGAEEYSAMDAAEGEVQHLGYTSTFPLLLNIDGVPTYVLSLKDKNELVKMYAMIQVEDYRNVVVDSDLGKLERKYLSRVHGVEAEDTDFNSDEEVAVEVSTGKDKLSGRLHRVEGVLSARHLINISGDSYIVFRLEGVEDTFIIPVLGNLDLLFVETGASIEADAYKYEK